MNLELFIASRIVGRGKAKFSKPIVRITLLSVVLGLMMMLISVAILKGFQEEIQKQISGFASHIQISDYKTSSIYDVVPISFNQSFYPYRNNIEGVNHIQVYAVKPGIIKTGEDMMGVMLKGVGSDYDWNYLEKHIIAGSSFRINDSIKSNKVLISSYVSKKLLLNVGDKFLMYFIQDPPRMRKFVISGIYQTGMEELDKLYVMGDIGHVRKLYGWEKDQVAGFEVFVDDFRDTEVSAININNTTDYQLYARTIQEIYPQIFDWLKLQDMNVVIILIIMMVVSMMAIVSTLLILVLENTKTIGVLKALGARSWSVRKIFMYNTMYIIGKGMIWGNLLALALCYIQEKYELIKLDQSSYYVSSVPVSISFSSVLAVNIGVVLVSAIVLFIPSYIIVKISPVKAIRFS